MSQDAADIVSKDHYARIHYDSTNQPLVAGRWDVIGGKTGYTSSAGYCFITGARFDDREVVMAFLGADGKLTRFDDFNRVAEWLARSDRGAPGGSGKLAVQRPRSAQPEHAAAARARIATH